MLLITCENIHQGHEWFSDDSRRNKIFFMCFYVRNFADSRIHCGAKISIKSYFMMLFFAQYYYSGAVTC